MKIYLEIILYISSILLIIGLRKLSNPKTANGGNSMAALALGLGIAISLFYPLGGDTGMLQYALIGAGIVIGGAIGLVTAKKVEMTGMPELVSLFNGFGGVSAAFISLVWLINVGGSLQSASDISVVYSNLFLGFVAFSGSMVAYGKLSGKLKDDTIKIPFASVVNIALLIAIVGMIGFFAYQGNMSTTTVIIMTAISIVYGVTFVSPIGGADMPVVISLLNSLTGITAAISGIMTDNKLMLLGGILVGSSGIILTLLMCTAMNRSLVSVLFGSFGGSKGAGQVVDGNISEVKSADLAVQLAYSQSVAIIPGYGMAVAQAQKVVKELEEELEKRDVELKYMIHPVAGRMPGHMNVLLAEADVSYDKLLDLEEANNFLANADVAIVVGANDVVNPSAKEDPSSKIYGMPILDVTKSSHVVVMKRSMGTGYAGIQNPLFFKDNTKMLFGDAKKSMSEILSELKGL